MGVRENEIQDAIRGQAILKRDEEVATLRAQLKSDWTSICVGRRHLDSCCGTATHGFRLTRSPSGIEVSTWFHPMVTGQSEQFGQPERLSQSHSDTLLHELPLHFLSAWLSLDPSEIAGPFLTDRSGQDEWRRAYHGAGGTDRQRDLDWIEIRIATASGVSSFVNLFCDHSPKDFLNWVSQFHKDEKKTASQ